MHNTIIYRNNLKSYNFFQRNKFKYFKNNFDKI